MGLALSRKARSLSCAFFHALFFLAGSACLAANCPPDRIEERVTVGAVIDGDSLILSDGRRIRLIGINTPELARDQRPAESGAQAAKNQLQRLIAGADHRIGLRLGAEQTDRYGRILAHAFLSDGTNLTASLLSRGAGFPITIPPNTWQSSCYQQAADTARTKKLGVWHMPAWRPKSSFNLPKTTRGFQRIIGVIDSIGESRDARWLNFSGDFSVKIPKDKLVYFNNTDWNQWKNKRVEVMGWVFPSKRGLRMNLHHPNALRRIP